MGEVPAAGGATSASASGEPAATAVAGEPIPLARPMLGSAEAQAGLEVSHPLLEAHETTSNGILLALTANRGLCGGYNGSAFRAALAPGREGLAAAWDTFRLTGRMNFAAHIDDLPVYKAVRYAPLSPALRKRLDDYYAEPTARLYARQGVDFRWSSRV